MANLTNEQIEQLQQQLKEKTKEVKDIYDQLVEAGVSPLPDDFLDDISGGKATSRPSYWRKPEDPYASAKARGMWTPDK